jgi:hypothetical protein
LSIPAEQKWQQGKSPLRLPSKPVMKNTSD